MRVKIFQPMTSPKTCNYEAKEMKSQILKFRASKQMYKMYEK